MSFGSWRDEGLYLFNKHAPADLTEAYDYRMENTGGCCQLHRFSQFRLELRYDRSYICTVVAWSWCPHVHLFSRDNSYQSVRRHKRGYPIFDIWTFRSPAWFEISTTDKNRSTFCCKSMQGFLRACFEISLACTTFSVAASLTYTLSQSRQRSICKLQVPLDIRYSATYLPFTSFSSSIIFPSPIGSDSRHMHAVSELFTWKLLVL